ncbi:hypothetical protein D3C87_1502950 [compost metagenome]
MQQVKTRLAIEGITAVQRRQFALGIFENLEIVAGLLILGIAPVADQREINLAMRIGEIMHLDIAHHLVDAVAAGQHAGHGNKRAGVLWNTVLELVSDQPERLHEESDERVEQTGRAFRSRQCKHQEECGHHIPGHARFGQEPADGKHDERGDEKHWRRNCEPVELAH